MFITVVVHGHEHIFVSRRMYVNISTHFAMNEPHDMQTHLMCFDGVQMMIKNSSEICILLIGQGSGEVSVVGRKAKKL